MSWGRYALALLAVYLLQTRPVAMLGLETTDCFLALALFYGLTAPRDEARLAAWGIGLLQDLGGAGAIGLHAFSLGLVGLLMTSTRDMFNLRAGWVRWLLGAATAWPGLLVVILHFAWWEGAAVGFGGLLLWSLKTAVIAGLLAAVVTTLPRFRGRRGPTYARTG